MADPATCPEKPFPCPAPPASADAKNSSDTPASPNSDLPKDLAASVALLANALSGVILQMSETNRLLVELLEQNGDLIQSLLQDEEQAEPRDLSGKPLKMRSTSEGSL